MVVLGTDKDDRARSRFDGAHELGHLVVHGEQIWGVKEVETQAHQFAAGFLLPAEQIYDQLPTTADWPALFELKRHWQVSLAALLMRARTLGRMTEGTYLSAIKTASARGWRRLNPFPSVSQNNRPGSSAISPLQTAPPRGPSCHPRSLSAYKQRLRPDGGKTVWADPRTIGAQGADAGRG